MYGMVVVDDKDDIVKGIVNLGEWDTLDVEIAGTASNGQEALEIIRRLKPGILITDIRMPLMDGLELTREAKQFDPSIKIILLSGYDDFSYAQQAVRLGAQEYLLKPAKIELIREAVLRAKEQIVLEERNYSESMKLKQKLRESLPLLKNEYLSSLLKFPVKSEEKMREKLDYLGIKLDSESFRVMVIILDDYGAVSSSMSVEEYELLIFAIMNIVEETINEVFISAVFKSDRSEIAVILNEAGAEDAQTCSDAVFHAAEVSRERMKRVLNTSISIGIGRHYTTARDICLSYREAVRAVQNSFITGRNSIICIDDIDMGASATFEYPYELAGELVQNVKIGATAKALEICGAFVAELQGRRNSSPLIIKRYFIYLMFELLKELMESGIETGGIAGGGLEYVNRLELCKTLEEINEALKEAISEISRNIHEMKKVNVKNCIDVIIEYINDNFTRDISLNDLARLVYMSPNYLSALIKEQLGENFVDRITRLRIEKAKLLLLSEGDKIYNIAEKVGYADRRYFSDIFKKYAGLTPSEYIEKYKKDSS